MRFTIKDLIYILIITTLAIIVFRGCGKSEPNTELIQPQLKPTVPKVDKAGTPYTEITGTLYTESQMKRLTDSLRKVLGKGKVQTVIQTVTDIRVEHSHDTLLVDLTTGEVYVADTNINYEVAYRGNFKTNEGKFYLHLQPDTAMYITTIKNPLFGRSTMVTNVYHSNLLFTPSMGTSYTAKAPKTIAAIGPVIGYGYSTKGWDGYIGVGLTIPVLSIKSKR